MAKIRVVIDWYRFPIIIDKLIGCRFHHVSKSTSWQNRRLNITPLYIFVRINCQHISFSCFERSQENNTRASSPLFCLPQNGKDESYLTIHLIFSRTSSRTSCVDITIRKDNDGEVVIRVHVQRGKFFASRRLQGLLKMAADRVSSVRDNCSTLLCQSIAINERFLCGYRLIIDSPIDTN